MKRFVPQVTAAAAVAALLAFGAGAAAAQSTMPSPRDGTSSSHSAAPGVGGNSPGGSASTAPMKNPLASEDVSQIDGVSVAASDGSTIGTVSKCS